jgi:uncharacterized protein HemY
LIVTVAAGIVVGTWLERYTWVSGSVDMRFYHTPMSAGFDVVVTIALIAVCFYAVRWSLRRYGLINA